MKNVLVLTGDPSELAKDLNKLFGFKVLKVRPCEVLQKEGLIPAVAVTYKTSKKKYMNFLDTRERYGF